MKRLFAVTTMILFVLTGCGDGNKQSADELIVVDVTKTYPSKRKLILQDFMDVEYIPLETNDEFITQGFVQAVGKNTLLVRNYNSDGDIFVFDRKGKALKKINRLGQGGEEYSGILGITLDEDNNEMFINDFYAKKMKVYDLQGNYKRSFSHKEDGGTIFYTDIFNYDKDNLLCYDSYNETISFLLVSKQDGSITKEIKIPFKEKKHLWQRRTEGEMVYTVSPAPHRTIIPYEDNWLLLEHSSDTVYTFLPDHSLRPFMVRTPSLDSMDPEVYMNLRLLSDRYYFMEAVKNEYDFNTENGFPTTYFMYDREEKDFFGYFIYDGNYSTPKEIYMSRLRPVSHEIESWQSIDAYQLVEENEKGRLKGKLKEVADQLDEEANPVIMLVKPKK